MIYVSIFIIILATKLYHKLPQNIFVHPQTKIFQNWHTSTV